MTEVFLISAARTPSGGGDLLAAHPAEPPFVQTELSYTVLQTAMQRLGADRTRLEAVIWGDSERISLHNALIHSGLPALSPGVLVGLGSLSSQQALHFAAQGILSGDLELALAGGVTLFPVKETDLCFNPMLRPLAERWAQEWNLDRAEMDELAGHEVGLLAPEPVAAVENSAVTVSGLLGADYCPPAPLFSELRPLSPQSPLTEAHFPECGCAAAAFGLASVQAVGRYNLSPRAGLLAHSLVSLGRDQAWAGIIPATRHALRRAGLTLEEIDLFLVSANFYGVEAVWAREFGVPIDKRLPVRCFAGQSSGAVSLVDLLDQLEARSLRYGLLASASHQGMGCVTIIERV